MKTHKMVVHRNTIAEAQADIATAVEKIPHHRAERQSLFTRLFGITGPPVVQFQATTWAECKHNPCKQHRELEQIRQVAVKRLQELPI